jgi:hypothetical protein
MRDLVAIVEGAAEQRVVQTLLAEHLATLGVRMWATLAGKPGHKGGAKPWQVVLRDIRRLARERPGRIVTTMFDFYALPADWPGRSDTSGVPVATRAQRVEEHLAAAVLRELGAAFDPSLFVPYVQMHELEALLFVDITRLGTRYIERHRAIQSLAAEVTGRSPEEINDSPHSAPSKRIIARVPEYAGDKVSVAPPTLRDIGLPALRAACPHFAAWVTKLESLAPGTPNR